MTSVSPGERVLVTGFTGSLGNALVPKLLAAGAKVRGLSRDEAKQLAMRRQYPEVECRLGDVRDPRAVFLAMLGMDTVIHAASLKMVDISERQPTEYVQTNVVGTMNVLDAAQRSNGVRRVVGISTDKCPRPVQVYGMTKALLEKLFIEAHLNALVGTTTAAHVGRTPFSNLDCAYVVARYGNVVASRGSVIPFWAEQRRQGKPLSVTDPTMTRFFFTLDDAVRLIDVALAAPSGTIVAQPMPACTLGQLAQAMWREPDWNGRSFEDLVASGRAVVVGRRPGEKIHEELLTAEEMTRTDLLQLPHPQDPDAAHRHFLYSPLSEPRAGRFEAAEPYTSDRAPRLTDDELRAMIKEWL